MPGTVIAVSRSPAHGFTKPNESSVRLLAGLGVEGDAHLGTTVQHRSRVAKDSTVPNLRQVHLGSTPSCMDFNLIRRGPGRPGAMGENVNTRGIDPLGSADRDPAAARQRGGGRGDRAA